MLPEATGLPSPAAAPVPASAAAFILIRLRFRSPIAQLPAMRPGEATHRVVMAEVLRGPASGITTARVPAPSVARLPPIMQSRGTARAVRGPPVLGASQPYSEVILHCKTRLWR